MNKIVTYSFLVVLVFVMIFPFLWMFSSAVKPVAEIFSSPPHLIPQEFKWENFIYVWERSHLGRVFKNTLIYAGGNTILSLFITTITAFGFAKYNFFGKNILFLLILMTIMVPIESLMVPLFSILNKIGWLNTYQGLILPRLVSPFGIFLLRQHFMSIPNALLDAARIDGTSEWGLLTRIMIPLSKSVLAVVALFNFLWRWNELMWPLIVATKEENYTFQVAVASFQEQFFIKWNYLMAVVCLSIIPLLALFMYAQRYFTKGITMSGLKN